jgi:hypothetical protein
MCDYSLECVSSRPAKVGDKLVTSRFPGTITRGFASVTEPGVAICVLPGTELAFERDVQCEGRFLFFLFSSVGSAFARFAHVNEDDAHRHHDALEFPNGRVVMLTNLRVGQRATVLQLPVGAVQKEEREKVVEERVVRPDPVEALIRRRV